MSSMASIPPTPSPAQNGSTFYVTLFAIGSVLLILLIIISCRIIFRANQASDDQPTEKQGLGREDSARSYREMSFSQAKIEHGDSSAEGNLACAICLAEYEEVDMVLVLPNCGHFFHAGCVDRWLRLHRTCPLCRDLPLLAPVWSNSGRLGGQEPGQEC